MLDPTPVLRSICAVLLAGNALIICHELGHPPCRTLLRRARNAFCDQLRTHPRPRPRPAWHRMAALAIADRRLRRLPCKGVVRPHHLCLALAPGPYRGRRGVTRRQPPPRRRRLGDHARPDRPTGFRRQQRDPRQRRRARRLPIWRPDPRHEPPHGPDVRGYAAALRAGAGQLVEFTIDRNSQVLDLFARLGLTQEGGQTIGLHGIRSTAFTHTASSEGRSSSGLPGKPGERCRTR
jgi:hypothetical protein